MTLQELYKSARTDGAKGETARQLLAQMHWIAVNAEFDPKTGEALPQALSAFLAKIARPATDGAIHDRLWRIAEHSRASLQRLFSTLNASPRREQALLPVRAVRELDANSFIKLSNRPGRTIREKLAGKPYLQAVRRFQSINLPENRLLKAFSTRLAELLELRPDCLNKQEDALLPKIESWLLSDEAGSIDRWDNLPPNNTLLSHRDYRRVWDAWRWLQTLDDDIARDFSQLATREKTMHFWNQHAQSWANGGHLFAEMPVLFEYEKFDIRPWFSHLAVKESSRKVTRNLSAKETLDPACVDLTVLRPRFATATQSLQALPDAYLWQQWKNDDESVDIELFKSDAAYLHPDVTSISSSALFFSKSNAPEHLDRAARAFASKLRDVFKSDTLIWLVPDFLNEFELEITRRNLNARFADAEPLPRSVAAVFEQGDPSRIIGNGYAVVVVDTIGGKTCATKLLAKFDEDLKTRLPITRGYYWERCPPVIIASADTEYSVGNGYDITTLDAQGQWRDATRPAKPQFIDSPSLKRDPRIGQFVFCINLTESPLIGGIRLHSLQKRARDIPLWRDKIPELSIKVMKDGRYQRFNVVSRDTPPVKPIRGQPVRIPVDEDFTLPAGRLFYQFPLFQGENADELGFSARLDSPAFPLKEDVVCKLNLTFEYGADEPYKLVFTPLNTSFPPVPASWRRTEEVVITNAPAPEYPPPMPWADLQHWVDPQGGRVDLLEWLCESLSRLHELIPKRCTLTITSHWKRKTDDSGKAYWFAFAATDNSRCYCNSKNIIDSFGEDPNDVFPLGTELFGNLKITDGGLSAFDLSTSEHIAPSREVVKRLISFKERSLQNRMSLIWADSRSLSDTDVPIGFKQECNELMSLLSHRLPEHVFNSKMLFLLACLHKDTADECVQWITGQVESGDIRDPRAVGFALGDVSEQWQEHALSKLVAPPTKDALRVFAYAIWREQHFVEKLNLAELKAILNSLNAMLGQIKPCPPRNSENDKWTVRNWVRATAEPLELLLGLLRTRASSDTEIKMLLQPHQRMTKELAKQVERVTEIVAQSNVTLFSRVQINLQKPQGDRTPDLLYALRLYLTGDDGANAIHIKSISDNDDD